MLKEYLQKADEALLWRILYDISGIMSDSMRQKGTNTAADNFWISVAGEIANELDRRLFINYDKDDLEDLDNEED